MKLKRMLAEYAHGAWAHWMRHLFKVSTLNEDGTVTIPKRKVDLWKGQIERPFEKLTGNEQSSDFDEAHKILIVVRRAEKALKAQHYPVKAVYRIKGRGLVVSVGARSDTDLVPPGAILKSTTGQLWKLSFIEVGGKNIGLGLAPLLPPQKDPEPGDTLHMI